MQLYFECQQSDLNIYQETRFINGYKQGIETFHLLLENYNSNPKSRVLLAEIPYKDNVVHGEMKFFRNNGKLR